MGTQEVELERAGEKSAVDGSDPVCSFIHNIHHLIHLGPHQLQTKAINHSTRHYMNRRELQSDQPIHVYRCCVYSAFLPRPALSPCIAGRRAPHLATTSRDTPAATVLSCAATRIHRDDLYRQNRVRSRSSGDPQHRSPVYIRYGLFGRAHCAG